MKYLAIDIETTGLDPERHQILEIGAVVETDWHTPVEALPTFRALVWHPTIHGDARALQMNAGLIAELARPDAVCSGRGGCVALLAQFVRDHFGDERVTIAGKNFAAFDLRFLAREPQWSAIKHRHRFVDVGPLFWPPSVDTCLPDLATCQKRAGFAPRPAHSAVEDCRAVIECVRAYYAKVGAA